MTFTKKAVINTHEILEKVIYLDYKVTEKIVTIDGKLSKMSYTQACNWAKKTDRGTK